MSDAEFDDWLHGRGRAGRSSPRSEGEPMAFTGLEFGRGLAIAIGAFSLLVSTVLLVAALVTIAVDPAPNAQWGGPGGRAATAFLAAGIALGVSLLVSMAAALVGGPIAWMIGRGLRREPRSLVHLAWHAANGLLVGALAVTVLLFAANRTAANQLLPAIVILPPLAAGAVAFGWWWTARIALRRDESQRADMSPVLGVVSGKP